MPEDNPQNQSPRTTAVAPLADRYELMERIGEGGMGTVYKARQIATDRIVAIKILSDQFVSDDVRRTRFDHEARAASSLYHPNLVSIIDFGCDDTQRPYLVQEYIPGIGLDDMLKAKGRLEPHDLIEIFSQICKGLSHVHHKGIVHRDLKPSNIMVCKDESGDLQVKIVDFGIAKQDRTQAITQTGELLGSPLYMSPEQALGQRVDARSDIYSVGCMLYECAIGKPPFMGENSITTLVMRLNQDPIPFEQAAPFANIPADLEKAIMRALRREPAERYQTIAALQADLKELERVQPKPTATIQGLRTLRSQEVSKLPVGEPFSDRPRWLEVGALMTVTLLLAGMAAGFAFLWSQSHNKTVPHEVASAPPVVAPPTPPVVVKEPPKPVPAKPKPVVVAATKVATPKIIPLPADVVADMAEAKQQEALQKALQQAERKAAILKAEQVVPEGFVLDANQHLIRAEEFKKPQQPHQEHQPEPLIRPEQMPSEPGRFVQTPDAQAHFLVTDICHQANEAFQAKRFPQGIMSLQNAASLLRQHSLENTPCGMEIHNTLSQAYAKAGNFDAAGREARISQDIFEHVRKMPPR